MNRRKSCAYIQTIVNEHRPLVPKEGGSGGYFLSVPGDFNLVVKVGAAFFALTGLIFFFMFNKEGDYQRESFQAALSSLSKYPQAISPNQRQSKLLKKDGVYSWRSVVWMKDKAEPTAWIWHAEVAREEGGFKLISSEMEPYDPDKARSLGVFDEVTSPSVREN